MSSLTDVRAVVIASSPLARAGLAALLADQPGIAIVGQVSADADFPESLDVYRPDALIWDMGWEPLNVLERLNDLRATPVVALLADERHAVDAVPMLLGVGARGILLEDAGSEALAAALKAVTQGMLVIHGSVADAALPSALSTNAAADGEVEALTPREAEVLNLIAEGLPNKTIAARLSISEHTVKFHVNAILTKLGAQSRTEAVVRATRLGLIAL